MANAANTSRHSATELRARHARGESKTDLARIDATSADALEHAALQQIAEDGMSADWFRDAVAVKPHAKTLISLRLDSDVVEWFRLQGPGYQTRINAVLKAYIKHAPAK